MPRNFNNAKTRELIQTRHCVELKPPRVNRSAEVQPTATRKGRCSQNVKRISEKLTETFSRDPQQESPTGTTNRNLYQETSTAVFTRTPPPPPTETPPTGTLIKNPNSNPQQEPLTGPPPTHPHPHPHQAPPNRNRHRNEHRPTGCRTLAGTVPRVCAISTSGRTTLGMTDAECWRSNTVS
ncbi:uncharacterized protein LOC125042049 [Penaeus chinensis]|uniref:uncharacterized protein LOC125042049 n=1 Tax=Penaeus chinensis TaxID=139456 RepID=UPI001FB839EC|nr:uncharacterized protein LOC125042049 [Penaeus chinensis]